MTGPEHYRAAEELLAGKRPEQQDTHIETIGELLARAQVHTTLALAAGFGLSAHLPMPDQNSWQQAPGGRVG
jgi:hypothetical protein